MNGIIISAKQYLDELDVDDATTDEIRDVFEAVFERYPDDGEDAYSLLLAAHKVLTEDQAKRVVAVLS